MGFPVHISGLRPSQASFVWAVSWGCRVRPTTSCCGSATPGFVLAPLLKITVRVALSGPVLPRWCPSEVCSRPSCLDDRSLIVGLGVGVGGGLPTAPLGRGVLGLLHLQAWPGVTLSVSTDGLLRQWPAWGGLTFQRPHGFAFGQGVTLFRSLIFPTAFCGFQCRGLCGFC